MCYFSQLYFQLWKVSVLCGLCITAEVKLVCLCNTRTALYLWYSHSVRLVMESWRVVIHISNLDVHCVLHHLHRVHTF